MVGREGDVSPGGLRKHGRWGFSQRYTVDTPLDQDRKIKKHKEMKNKENADFHKEYCIGTNEPKPTHSYKRTYF